MKQKPACASRSRRRGDADASTSRGRSVRVGRKAAPATVTSVPTVEEVAELGSMLAEGAGELARTAFGSKLASVPKTSILDVATEIDHVAERLIIAGVRERFPDHGVIAEESGVTVGNNEWTWLVDPLDGTNNFAIGLPLYGVSIVVERASQPVAAVIRDSHLRRQVVATKHGLRLLGNIRVEGPSAAAHAIVALQQGYGVHRSDPALGAARAQLESRYKRVLYTWAPSIDMLLLASGAISGILAIRCAGAEHVATRFLAEQIGCDVRIMCDPGCPPGSATYVVGWRSTVDELVDNVRTTIDTQ